MLGAVATAGVGVIDFKSKRCLETEGKVLFLLAVAPCAAYLGDLKLSRITPCQY